MVVDRTGVEVGIIVVVVVAVVVVVVSSFSINRKNKLNQIAPTYQALFRKGPVRQQRSQANPLHLETVKAN